LNLEANSSALTFGKSKSTGKGRQMICKGGSNVTATTDLRNMCLLKKVTWWLFWKCLRALLFKWDKFVIERDTHAQILEDLSNPSTERDRLTLKPQIRLLPHKRIKNYHVMLF